MPRVVSDLRGVRQSFREMDLFFLSTRGPIPDSIAVLSYGVLMANCLVCEVAAASEQLSAVLVLRNRSDTVQSTENAQPLSVMRLTQDKYG